MVLLLLLRDEWLQTQFYIMPIPQHDLTTHSSAV